MRLAAGRNTRKAASQGHSPRAQTAFYRSRLPASVAPKLMAADPNIAKLSHRITHANMLISRTPVSISSRGISGPTSRPVRHRQSARVECPVVDRSSAMSYLLHATSPSALPAPGVDRIGPRTVATAMPNGPKRADLGAATRHINDGYPPRISRASATVNIHQPACYHGRTEPES